MKALIEVLKNNPNNAYDYLASNYYKMSKEELRDVAKELLYSIYENTLESIMYAVKNNLIVEIDVRLSKDEELIVYHDDDAGRMLILKDAAEELTDQYEL